MDCETKYWVALNAVKGLTPKKLYSLERECGGAAGAWNASPKQLGQAELSAANIQSLTAFRSTTTPEQELQKVQALGALAVSIRSEQYPQLLREINNPPAVLYFRGQLPTHDEHTLAVVGSRRATRYGNEACRRICSDLARHGVTVVSGLALGIDAVAHKTAVENGGRTVAVLASGIDKIFPSSHTSLARSIVASGGAVLTEHCPGSVPLPAHFPSRNRIVSGLSAGVLVVEAGNRSGALITAEWALQQGREVMAVPGNITSALSYGANRLLRTGARLVMGAEDVLDEFGWKSPANVTDGQNQSFFTLAKTALEKLILKTLMDKGTPMHVDDLVRATSKPVHEIGASLGMLVITGALNEMGGGIYSARVNTSE